jgi:alpha,alpha-trehalase
MRVVLALLSLVLLSGPAAARDFPAPPASVFGDLYTEVQLQNVFPDSKTFADAVPKRTPAEILQRFHDHRREPGFSLASFVNENFEVPVARNESSHTLPNERVEQHIDRLWQVLTRSPQAEPAFSSRLSLPLPYVVPGGRFQEVYYWDSYFTMIGLQASGEHELVSDMISNFAFLIDQWGHIPNGNRTYYLSRSQPPFFAAMVELEAKHLGDAAYTKRLPQLKREYEFWMEGADTLQPGQVHRRVVKLKSSEILNRYWDDRDTPRDESYREDVATAKQSGRDPAEVYRNLRAAAESGWDFSSRWLADGKTLATVRTTELVPVDLNSLLFQLETTIARACKIQKDDRCASEMNARAAARRNAIQKLLWSEGQHAFVDYDWTKSVQLPNPTAATVYPLYFNVVDDAQVSALATTIREKFLKPRGLATTMQETGQQWDAPNGWAPLQWMAIEGLRTHKQQQLAATIAQRWVAANVAEYRRSGKLVEKYNVNSAGEGGGGEYPNQDGFGWTNGVLRKLLVMYPELARQDTRYKGN